MKKHILIALAVLQAGSAAQAQESTPAQFKLYGFIRNYTVLDSRAVNGGTHDLYFYMPKDENLNDYNEDLNAGLNWKSLALTTRLGVNVSGYRYGRLKVNGAVEADFYSLNGTSASSTIAQLRLRQAYVGLGWDLKDGDRLLLNVGQTWHPMAADMPHITNLETGAPFNPFNRSPQVMAHYTTGAWTFTGGALYLSQYLPTGPNGKSAEYFKYGLPELYLGAAYKADAILAKAGVDVLNTRPVRMATDAYGETVKVTGFLTAFTPFAFFQYTSTTQPFQLRAKVTLAQSGEHLNLLSGYGLATVYDRTKHAHAIGYAYTPMQDLASWVSVQYGKKVQFMAMAGYMKQLGTTRDLLDASTSLWINTAADTKIQQAFRLTPTVAWNWGKLTVSLEYNLTAADFGRGTRNNRGLYAEHQWILNHRLVNMVKFNF